MRYWGSVQKLKGISQQTEQEARRDAVLAGDAGDRSVVAARLLNERLLSASE